MISDFFRFYYFTLFTKFKQYYTLFTNKESITKVRTTQESRRTCWTWSAERTSLLFAGLLYNRFLFVYSVARAKQECSGKKRARSPGCHWRNADKKSSLRCGDGQKTPNSNVRMTKTRPPSRRMLSDYQVKHLAVTEQKCSSLKRKSR